MGPAELTRRVAALAAGRNGWAWEPAPLIAIMAGKGAGFATLNTE